MEVLYQQFIRERQYLLNVSDKTVEAYKWAWKAFEPALKRQARSEQGGRAILRIAELCEDGLSAVTVNTYLRSVNALANWMVKEGHAQTLTVIPRL
jgi:site-specific recombinase XerD